MLKLFEYLKLDERVYDLFNRMRAELVSKGHDEVWAHTLRVIRNLYAVREVFEFDFKKALIAAICHDIGYNEVINGHEKAGALMAKPLLDGMYDHKMVGELIHCIESHECDTGIKPQTPEAMALHDADMLDYCSEHGVINAFVLGKSLGLSDSVVSKRIVNMIDEGFLILAVKSKHASDLAKTERFFLELVKDLNKERADFIEYGLKNV